MKRNPGKRILGMLAVLLAAAVLVLVPGRAVVQQEPPPPSEVPPISIQVDKGDPKIEHSLFMFQKIYETQGLEKAKEYADRRRIDLEGDRVLVVVETDASIAASDNVNAMADAVANFIQFLGGRVETRYEELIQCRVPAGGLQELSRNPLVRHVRLPLKPVTQAVTSEGVNLTGANVWQAMDSYRNTAAGVKVCILDVGFKGYASLLGTELPSSVTARSFRSDGDIEADEVHGTACAEIVHDMAPDAELYLVNFNTDVEQHQAVNWLISEGVEVISYSIAWFNAGDGKGTGPICQDVTKAADSGILWAGAAGNYAEDHWEGTYSDTDSDGWHNFSGVNEVLSFYVPAWTPVAAFLNWDDWGTWSGVNYSGSNQDYDLALYYWTGTYWMYVDGSYNWQTGTQWPEESIGYWYSDSSAYWGIAIRRWSTTRNCKLELFTYGNSSAIQYNVKEGSLAVPADSASCIAVGATDAVSDALHDYSSRGPTHDGRVKPDFCAPSGVSTQTYDYIYGPRSFYGTSASAPHMAGAIALIKGMTPYSLSQVKTILEQRAVDMGDTGKDNIYGVGRLNLKK